MILLKRFLFQGQQVILPITVAAQSLLLPNTEGNKVLVKDSNGRLYAKLPSAGSPVYYALRTVEESPRALIEFLVSKNIIALNKDGEIISNEIYQNSVGLLDGLYIDFIMDGAEKSERRHFLAKDLKVFKEAQDVQVIQVNDMTSTTLDYLPMLECYVVKENSTLLGASLFNNELVESGEAENVFTDILKTAIPGYGAYSALTGKLNSTIIPKAKELFKKAYNNKFAIGGGVIAVSLLYSSLMAHYNAWKLRQDYTSDVEMNEALIAKYFNKRIAIDGIPLTKIEKDIYDKCGFNNTLIKLDYTSLPIIKDHITLTHTNKELSQKEVEYIMNIFKLNVEQLKKIGKKDFVHSVLIQSSMTDDNLLNEIHKSKVFDFASDLSHLKWIFPESTITLADLLILKKGAESV